MSALYEAVAQRLHDLLGVPRELITPEATFVDLKLDSLGLVEFSVILDEEFGVPPTELRPDSTFADAVALVAANASGPVQAEQP
ncbi:phosphopantetheine-binding protein [Kitasatospora sp. NPDC036755]|uniref:acyl carrier protein n=1 Tax=Kitasatospora sp. NPDC036755 TaxID=3154600 RepID=UPI0033FE16F8